MVRGDKESIKNLLEIFDGLLEYLNEESQNGGTYKSYIYLISLINVLLGLGNMTEIKSLLFFKTNPIDTFLFFPLV